MLDLQAIDRNGEIKTVTFQNKQREKGTGISVNHNAYREYINQNYPDLHVFDIKQDDSDVNDALFQQQLSNDNRLLNKLDILQYEGHNSADDIWDSITKSVYHMGFMGRYSRVATSIEAGINYIATFEEFAHVSPFLKAYRGDASLLRKLQNQEMVDSKRYDSYKLHYKPRARDRLGGAANTHYNLKDVELERRCISNHSLILRPEDANPPGSEWSYLSVDKDDVVLGKSYRGGYESDVFDNRRYIYEKFLFCASPGCPGAIRIILDCIHNVVIIRCTNPHYDCSESQRRMVYDIVRKLFVTNMGDLNLIDFKYKSIPRRYGLAYVESWIKCDEFETTRRSEYLPSFFQYKFDHKKSACTWSTTKNRTWVVDSFYETTTEVDTEVDKQAKLAEKSYIKRKHNYADDDEDSIRLSDLQNYGIDHWRFDTHRFDYFGNIIKRSEWEFHISQDAEYRLREVFRIWRKFYFGVTDFVRETSSRLKMSQNFPLMKYYIKNGGYDINLNKLNIFSLKKDVGNDFSFDESMNFLKNIYGSMQSENRFDWTEFDNVLFRLDPKLKLLPNPESYVLPYPLNQNMMRLDADSRINVLENELGCFFITRDGVSIESLFNSNKIVIVERKFEYRDMKKSENAKLMARSQNIHPSDQLWGTYPHFEDAFSMMCLYDDEFIKSRYVVKRFKSNRLGNKTQTIPNLIRDDCYKLTPCYFNMKQTGLEQATEGDASKYLAYRIIYEEQNETGKVLRYGYLICHPDSIPDVIRLIRSKRVRGGEKQRFLILGKHQDISDFVDDGADILQVDGIDYKKMVSKIPFETLLLCMLAIVKGVRDGKYVDAIIGSLKKKLPVQRLSDVDMFRFEIEGVRIALNAGLTRNYIGELIKGVEEFKKGGGSIPLSGVGGELVSMMVEGMSHFGNVIIRDDPQRAAFFEWAINVVINDDASSSASREFRELLFGDYRDVYELIKRCVEFV